MTQTEAAEKAHAYLDVLIQHGLTDMVEEWTKTPPVEATLGEQYSITFLAGVDELWSWHPAEFLSGVIARLPSNGGDSCAT